MNNAFAWCRHCGEPHPITERVCPVTAQPLNTTLHTTSPERPWPASAPAPVHPMVGSVIDNKYRIRSVLGEGGMGTVFEAQHLLLQRSVALKLIRPTMSDPLRAMKRMQHEARIAGAIGHPHICDVYDIGELPDGSPYLVMQRLVGETLADAIARERPFPAHHGIQIMIEVLSGLHSAHQMSVVHRDLKPQNIFLAERVGCEPLAKVLDFGLSKMTGSTPPPGAGEELSSMTAIGSVVGTRFYMAPEQIVGAEVDARADLFACGLILYETLSGQKPFAGSYAEELVTQPVAAAPVRLTVMRPELPAEADVVIARSLARNREYRYQSAKEFQDDLHALRDALSPRAARRGDSRKIPSMNANGLPSFASSSDSSAGVDAAVGSGSTDASDESEALTNVAVLEDEAAGEEAVTQVNWNMEFPPEPKTRPNH